MISVSETKKNVIRELKSKGNLNKYQQYIRVVYLPQSGDLMEKFSIEVGKILDDGTYSRPTSFRSSSKTQCLLLIEALMQIYLIMEGDPMDLRRAMHRVAMRMRGHR